MMMKMIHRADLRVHHHHHQPTTVLRVQARFYRCKLERGAQFGRTRRNEAVDIRRFIFLAQKVARSKARTTYTRYKTLYSLDCV
jgi:hypothetical protein